MKKNWLEWSVFGLSLLLIGATVVYLALDAATDRGRPPILDVHTKEPKRAGDGWRLPFVVRNTGDTSAEAVQLEAKAGNETATASIDYVPRGSQREGAFVFSDKPAEPKARVTGYQEP